MPRRIHLEPHLTDEELHSRYRQACDPVEPSLTHILAARDALRLSTESRTRLLATGRRAYTGGSLALRGCAWARRAGGKGDGVRMRGTQREWRSARWSQWLWMALLVVGVLLLAACDSGAGGTASPTATNPGGSLVSSNGTPQAPAATATPTTADVTTPGAQVGASDVCAQPPSVTAQLPASIPAYPGAQLRLGQTSGGNGLFGLCTGATVSAIGQFYTSQLPNKGWQQVQSGVNGDVEQVSATKGSGQVFITIEPDPQISGQT